MHYTKTIDFVWYFATEKDWKLF